MLINEQDSRCNQPCNHATLPHGRRLGRLPRLDRLASLGVTGAFFALLVFAVTMRSASAQAEEPPPPEPSQTLSESILPQVEQLAPATSTPRSTFLPFVPTSLTTLPVGDLTLVTGPYACAEQDCYDVQVQCSQLAQPIAATLRVGEPTGQPTRGTIIFFSGYTGMSFWQSWGQGLRVVTELRAAGYRTVQVKWGASWYFAAHGEAAGMMRLACRGATVTQWVSNTWQTAEQPLPLCVYGHSNGATAAGFLLARYGLANILSAVMIDAGPNYSRQDVGCLHDDPQLSALWYPEGERNAIDRMFGYPTPGTGPCYRQDASFRPQLEQNSMAVRPPQQIYPNTTVHFVFGELDTSTTRAHGEYFYQQLTAWQTPLLARDVIAGAGHVTVDTTEGADAIRDGLLADCRLR
jgi:hypothetical protein